MDPVNFAFEIFSQAMISRLHIKDIFDLKAMKIGTFKLKLCAERISNVIKWTIAILDSHIKSSGVNIETNYKNEEDGIYWLDVDRLS